MEILEQMISGIISGVCASIIFTVIQFLIKPKCKVSDIICINRNDEGFIMGEIKIANLGKSMLMNVKYSLQYCVDYEDGLSDISEIIPKKTPINTLSSFSKKNTDYAVRITYEWSEKQYPLNDNSKLIFTLQATHPLSNTSKCIEKVYCAQDLKRGNFEFGRSFGFIATNRERIYNN